MSFLSKIIPFIFLIIICFIMLMIATDVFEDYESSWFVTWTIAMCVLFLSGSYYIITESDTIELMSNKIGNNMLDKLPPQLKQEILQSINNNNIPSDSSDILLQQQLQQQLQQPQLQQPQLQQPLQQPLQPQLQQPPISQDGIQGSLKYYTKVNELNKNIKKILKAMKVD